MKFMVQNSKLLVIVLCILLVFLVMVLFFLPIRTVEVTPANVSDYFESDVKLISYTQGDRLTIWGTSYYAPSKAEFEIVVISKEDSYRYKNVQLTYCLNSDLWHFDGNSDANVIIDSNGSGKRYVNAESEKSIFSNVEKPMETEVKLKSAKGIVRKPILG